MNLLSLTDYYGEGVTKHLQKLVDKGLYDFVGSDIHHKNHVAAFQNKVMIKNYQILEETMAKNVLFK